MSRHTYACHYLKISHENEIIWSYRDQIISFYRISKNGWHGAGSSAPPEPKLDPPLLIHVANAQTFWLHHARACNSYVLQKNIWAELSYDIGPSCLINLGRVGMGRVLCGPSWFWSELSVIRI